MGAVVHVDFRAERAKRVALAKAERVRELAEELSHYKAGEARSYMAGYYEGQGWADAHDLLLAMAALEEP